MLKSRKFDLLIFDINLPDGSGLECGADDYLTKPFSLMVLRARIRALLRRNVGEQKSEYRAVLLGKTVIPRILSLLNTSLKKGEVIQAQPWVFLTAALFAFLTNLQQETCPNDGRVFAC